MADAQPEHLPQPDRMLDAAALEAQDRMPLLETMREYGSREMASFHVPGHRHGLGASDDVLAMLGPSAFHHDIPVLPETDSLNNPIHVIEEAEQLAARAWGAEKTFFLVNGSTVGNQAALMNVSGPGDRVIVPRSAHRSMLGGLILSGAEPVFVMPEWDQRLGIAHGVSPAAIMQTLLRTPDARAVFLVSPTYHGVTSDVVSIASTCDRRGLPLIVDEAWGAHLRFHPELPASAIECGADIVVQSTHKTLAAMTQASMLHVQGRGADFRRDILGVLHSTSPSFLLLASLDAARRQMVQHGAELIGSALELARDMRSRINEIPTMASFGTEIVGRSGVHGLDELRVTVDVSRTGLTGVEVRDELRRVHDVQPEMAGACELVFIVGIGTHQEDVDRVVAGLAAAATKADLSRPSIDGSILVPTMVAEAHLTPREAFFAPWETVSFDASLGRTSVEIVAPYPPGIPVLVPGERITREALDILRIHRAAGSAFNGPADSSLETLRVVR